MFMQKRDSSTKRGYIQVSASLRKTARKLDLPVLVAFYHDPELFAVPFTVCCRNLKAWGFLLLARDHYARNGMQQYRFLVSCPYWVSKMTNDAEAHLVNAKRRPDPLPGKALELGFLGSVMQAEIPRSENEHQSIATSSFGEKFNVKVHVRATSFMPRDFIKLSCSFVDFGLASTASSLPYISFRVIPPEDLDSVGMPGLVRTPHYLCTVSLADQLDNMVVA